MKLKERTYFRATDADAVFRIVDDPKNEVLMGYFANPRVKTWGRNPAIISDIETGNSEVEPITREEALEILKRFDVTPDEYDG
jgi:hypothetical protein